MAQFQYFVGYNLTTAIAAELLTIETENRLNKGSSKFEIQDLPKDSSKKLVQRISSNENRELFFRDKRFTPEK